MTTITDYEALLADMRPASLLAELGEGALSHEQVIYKAEALLMLDRDAEVEPLIQPLLEHLEGETAARAYRLWGSCRLNAHHYDEVIFAAKKMVDSAQYPVLRATGKAMAAVGYARKRCRELAEASMREGIEIATGDERVLAYAAYVRQELDDRLGARAIFERIALSTSPRMQARADMGLAHIALLLGDFTAAEQRARAALAFSPEWLSPLHTLAYLALSTENIAVLQEAVDELARRSPHAETLPPMRAELEKLQAHATGQPSRKQLSAFPSTLQRRNYCGPCTIELVLRYWKGGLDLTNDQIARAVKEPGGGTSPYKAREFFHLVGFDTVRCIAPVETLMALIDAGFPAIIEEMHPNTAHVAVVIGYDRAAQTLLLQDPMSHVITEMPMAEVARIRRNFFNSTLVAFPAGQRHEDTLARLGVFNDEVVEWTDQASVLLDAERNDEVIALLTQAVRKAPGYGLAWMIWLSILDREWATAQSAQQHPLEGLAAKLPSAPHDPAGVMQRLNEVLAQARIHHPEEHFIAFWDGMIAQHDGRLREAVAAYERAKAIEPYEAATLTRLAECLYALRQYEAARVEAANAVQYDGADARANAWMARCLAMRGEARAEHYGQCAVEQAPDWWLTRLAYGEALFACGHFSRSHRELQLALGLARFNADTHLALGRLHMQVREATRAVTHFEQALGGPELPSISTTCLAHQYLAQILCACDCIEEALAQCQALLHTQPDDPWGMAMLATIRGEMLQQDPAACSETALRELRELFAHALKANHCASWVALNYITAVKKGWGDAVALTEVGTLRTQYPAHGHLAFLAGQLLAEGGQQQEAARAMLEALGAEDGFGERDQLRSAIGIILQGLGAEAGEAAILAAPRPLNGPPDGERERALGLMLINNPAKKARGHALLCAALEHNPNDPLVLAHLADVVDAPGEQERYLARAVLLAPEWSYTRRRLADFLIDADRGDEALMLTRGHEHETSELMFTHARALLSQGHRLDGAAALAKVFTMTEERYEVLYQMRWWAEHHSGLYEQALATALEGAERFPERLDLRLHVAESFNILGRHEEARQYIERSKADGLDQERIDEFEFESAWDRQDWAAALSVTERTITQTHPRRKQVGFGGWGTRHVRALLALGRDDEAVRYAETLEMNAEEMGEMAWMALYIDRFEISLLFAERSLALDPLRHEALYARAAALMELDYPEAVEAIERLRQAHPTQHNSYEMLALMKALAGAAEEALPPAERAVALGPGCHCAWATLGYIHFLLGNKTAAQENLRLGRDRTPAELLHKDNIFWWVLALLERDPAQADRHHQLAREEARRSRLMARELSVTEAFIERA